MKEPMKIEVVSSVPELNRLASAHAAALLKDAISARGRARLVAATGSSQLGFLDALTSEPDIDWSLVELFHLDEYVGLEQTHPASFSRFLLDRLILKAGIKVFHLLDGGGDPTEVMSRIGREIRRAPIDLVFAGIGENGHLAFNEPPADFEATSPYILVKLDETSRRQQVGEGWFKRLEDVPRQAVTMTIRQILSAKDIVCLVHGTRKASAVEACFHNDVSADAPASILRTHDRAVVYLDKLAAAGLTSEDLSGFAK